MSDAGKVVKMEDGKRYLITEGSLKEGWFGGQRIVRWQKGLRAYVKDGEVYSAFGLTGPLDGEEVWLDEMHRTLSVSEVVSVTPYKEPRARKPKPAVVKVEVGPRSRPSMLSERTLALC